MCTLTVSDFDALDVLDADSVLIAGDISASEKRVAALHLAELPFVRSPFGTIKRAIAGETRDQKRLENSIGKREGATTGRVIVH